MIILDANVISELMKSDPNSQVLSWFDKTTTDTVYITSINVAEIWYGVHSLPDGKRKKGLSAAVSNMFEQDFQGGVLGFDESAAQVYGILGAQLREKGAVIGQSDTMITAIALSHDALVITPNTKHLELAGVSCVNPFEG